MTLEHPLADGRPRYGVRAATRTQLKAWYVMAVKRGCRHTASMIHEEMFERNEAERLQLEQVA